MAPSPPARSSREVSPRSTPAGVARCAASPGTALRRTGGSGRSRRGPQGRVVACSARRRSCRRRDRCEHPRRGPGSSANGNPSYRRLWLRRADRSPAGPSGERALCGSRAGVERDSSSTRSGGDPGRRRRRRSVPRSPTVGRRGRLLIYPPQNAEEHGWPPRGSAGTRPAMAIRTAIRAAGYASPVLPFLKPDGRRPDRRGVSRDTGEAESGRASKGAPPLPGPERTAPTGRGRRTVLLPP